MKSYRNDGNIRVRMYILMPHAFSICDWLWQRVNASVCVCACVHWYYSNSHACRMHMCHRRQFWIKKPTNRMIVRITTVTARATQRAPKPINWMTWECVL